MELFASSDFLSELLARNPDEISSLALFHGGECSANSDSFAVEDLGCDSCGSGATAGQKLTLLRRHYRACVFASGVRDVLQHPDVFESLRGTTAIALRAVRTAAEIVGLPPALGVFTLGRLGTDEFDILSDVDLVFVREESLDQETATRCAVELMQVLSAYTREGSMFPVDARLRPHGKEGELVVTAPELLRYCEVEAQAWEALTWTKLGCVCGSVEVRDATFKAAEKLFARFAADSDFTRAVAEMRQRLERSDESENIKTGPGGLYDLDFLAGLELVRHGPQRRFGGNLHARLDWLAAIGVLSGDQHRAAESAARLLRTVEHAIRLASGTARKSLPATGHAREAVEAYVSASLPQRSGSLSERLQQARTEVREILTQALGASEPRHVRYVTNQCDD